MLFRKIWFYFSRPLVKFLDPPINVIIHAWTLARNCSYTALHFFLLYILSKWTKKLSMAIHGKSGCKSHNHFYWARLRSGGVLVGGWLEVQTQFNRLNFRLIQDVSQPIPGRWKVIIKIATKWTLLPCAVWLGYWWVHFGSHAQFKVDRLQVILVAKNIYIFTCRKCSSVGCLKCVQFYNWFRLH